jgi:hypothetical protein
MVELRRYDSRLMLDFESIMFAMSRVVWSVPFVLVSDGRKGMICLLCIKGESSILSVGLRAMLGKLNIYYTSMPVRYSNILYFNVSIPLKI